MEPTGVLSRQWKHLYQNALLETDNGLLPPRIVAAEVAIRGRLDELEANPDVSFEEYEVLVGAKAMLACLRRMSEKGNVA